MNGEILRNYINSLINLFFKILPLRESGEESLPIYLTSLQEELIGCKEFVIAINEDPAFLSLISILQYLIDNPECSVRSVRRKVFQCISVCNKLKEKYTAEPEV